MQTAVSLPFSVRMAQYHRSCRNKLLRDLLKELYILSNDRHMLTIRHLTIASAHHMEDILAKNYSEHNLQLNKLKDMKEIETPYYLCHN